MNKQALIPALIILLLVIAVNVLAKNHTQVSELAIDKYKKSRSFDPDKKKVVGMATTKPCYVVRKPAKIALIRDAKKILPKGTAFMIVQARVNISIGAYTGTKDKRRAKCIIWWQYPVDKTITNGTILVITKS